MRKPRDGANAQPVSRRERDQSTMEPVTRGMTEVQPDKQTPGVLPDKELYREARQEGFTIPPAEWGKTSGSPSGGTSGGTPAQQLEKRKRRQEVDDAETGE